MISINNWIIPLYNALKGYRDSNPAPFHMPGHKLGKGLPAEFADKLASIDVTEIPGTDNLHFPDGPIAEAQRLAAEAFGADETFFLVNGSTVGIHAMIMSACKPGDKLIVGRDSHKSVINGMMLAGVTPVYIKPDFSRDFGIPSVILPSDVEEAIRQNPDAVGVLITRPNYYGVCSDIEEIVRIVHKYDKILAVDEAHGAHLAFSSTLPVPALSAGADICVQSAHKTLPALTQASYLHVTKGRIDVDKLKFYLRMLQTSSPSYIIMASLDIARAIMKYRGYELLDELDVGLRRLRDLLGAYPGLRILGEEDIHQGSHDWTRLVFNTAGLGITGFETDKLLRAYYNIQVEMSDYCNTVCIATVSDDDAYFERLAKAFHGIWSRLDDKRPLAHMNFVQPELPVIKIGFKDLINYESIKLPLKEAVGRISMDMVTPYPPGIPAICPGEMISRDIVEHLYRIIDAGGTINGLGNNNELNIVK